MTLTCSTSCLISEGWVRRGVGGPSVVEDAVPVGAVDAAGAVGDGGGDDGQGHWAGEPSVAAQEELTDLRTRGVPNWE